MLFFTIWFWTSAKASYVCKVEGDWIWVGFPATVAYFFPEKVYALPKVSYIFISREKTSFTQNWTEWSEWVEFAVYFFFHSFKCWWEIKICQCNMFLNFKRLLAKMTFPCCLQKKPPLKISSFCFNKKKLQTTSILCGWKLYLFDFVWCIFILPIKILIFSQFFAFLELF